MGSEEKHHFRGYRLIFKDVGVQIGKQTILSGVNGLAEPGQMLAIMGPSGAGKTTLLNCLAGRREVDSGSITMNSFPINKQLRRKISFVLQSDIFMSELTCWETIWYTALLRLPGSMPVAEKRKRALEIVDALDMRKCLNTKVGADGHVGLSGGERKRTTIACELLTNPALMLLDEPTSGLDSSTAHSLCQTIKEFAKVSGKTVIMTIHQPSSKIFNLFDKLLLLCDGRVAFYGDIQRCASFFDGLDIACPTNYNLSDHILDQVKETKEIKDKILQRAEKQREESWYPKELKLPIQNGHSLKISSEHLPTDQVSLLKDSGYTEGLAMTDICSDTTKLTPVGNFYEQEKFSYGDVETGDMEFEDSMSSTDEPDEIRFRKEYDAKWPTGFWMQYNVLLRRGLRQAIPRILSKWNILQVIITALFGGILWFKMEPKEEALTDRQGIIFFALIFLGFYTLIDAMLSYPAERTVVNKERLAGYYRLSAFYLAKMSSDIPLLSILPTIFLTITYWMSAINLQFSVYIQMWLCVMLTSFLSHSIGMFYCTLILDLPVSMMFSTTTMLVLTLAGGYYVRNIPVWIRWIKYIAFTQHGFYAILTIDIQTTKIGCAASGSSFLACSKGDNSSLASDATKYIPEEDLLNLYTLAGEGWEVWHHILVCVVLTLIARVSTYIVLRYIRKPHLG